MAQIFPRRLGPVGSLQPGEYRKIRHIGVAIIRCPICLEPHRISDKTHQVAADGTVTPIWRCPTCPYSDWIVLESWGEP